MTPTAADAPAPRGRAIKNLKRKAYDDDVRAKDRASLARMLGCSWQVLKNLEFSGEVVLHDDGYHVREIQKLLIDREGEKEQRRSSKAAADDRDAALTEWRQVNTEIARLELNEKAGQLLLLDSVRDGLQLAGSRFRDRLKSLPGRMALQLEGRNRVEIEAILAQEVRVVADECQHSLDSIWIRTAADELKDRTAAVAVEPEPSAQDHDKELNA